MLGTSKDIFISHAVADKDFADTVVDLLATGMEIQATSKVFCSSLEGLGIPTGQDFKSFIKGQIQSPKIVVILISQNYLASHFCMAEAGAAWAMSHNVVPVLIPPTDYEDMKAVLQGTQAIKINDASGWNEALAIFKQVLEIDPNTNRWERKRDDAIQKCDALIPKQKPAPLVPLQKLDEAQKKAVDANKEITELESELKRLKELNEALKKVKDNKEAAAVEAASLPTYQQFNKVVDAAKEALDKVPYCVQEALYCQLGAGGTMPVPRGGFTDSEDKWDDIRDAMERGMLRESHSEGYLPNEDSPKVRKAAESLRQLEELINSHPELAELYEAENEDEVLDFRTRDFWERNGLL